MNETDTLDAYGTLIEPATLKIQRLLPGPVERIFSYLTDSDLRRKWLASGDMDLTAGAPFTLTWRNDELGDQTGKRPEEFSEENSMDSHIIEVDEPHKLTFSWGKGEVQFLLTEKGDKVLLTLIHTRISDRKNEVMIGAGWHTHLDVLCDILEGRQPPAFWPKWRGLRDEYEQRIPK